jgi:hypothetical protein
MTQNETVGLGLSYIAVSIFVYMVPWMVARTRRHKNSGAIFALNLFMGWTLIGWVAALVWALTNPQAQAPTTVVYVTPNAVGPDGVVQPQQFTMLPQQSQPKPSRLEDMPANKRWLIVLAILGGLILLGTFHK